MIEKNPVETRETAPQQPLDIQFLYWEECPAYQDALKLLESVLDDTNVAADVKIHRVDTDEEAAALQFPGSPTIRVGGLDIDANPELPLGLSCRVYKVNGSMSGVPPREMIVEAILKAR